MGQINWMNKLTQGAVVTASALGVSWLFSTLLKQPIQALYSTVPVVSPVTGTVGEKALGLVGGYIPLGNLFGLSNIIAVFISALVLLFIGEWMVDKLKLPGFPLLKGNASRLAMVIFAGAVPLYIVLVGLVVPTLMTVVGVAIYSAILALVAGYLSGFLNLK